MAEVFTGELKKRTPHQMRSRIYVLGMRVFGDYGDVASHADMREELKLRCAREHLDYGDRNLIDRALNQAKGPRAK